jgi:fumarylacetoacetase
MTTHLDDTHDHSRRSWVTSANGHAVFPLQNLPFGVFSPRGGAPRGGVAIGDHILDLAASLQAGLLSGDAEVAAVAASGATLNPLLALGRDARVALRAGVFALLAEGGAAERAAATVLHSARECTVHLPAAIANYTDFYAGIHHAYNGGLRNKRPSPLLPNYKYVPVAYHGRASSVIPSGTPVHRPHGQRKLPEESAPTFGPCRKLDIELELGVWIGPGNRLGSPIPISQAGDHVAGLCMLNDWSARDIQSWEMAPLGPFLAKNFSSTVSPWIVTMEALAPFRQAQRPRAADDPKPLPYLWDEEDQASGAFDITLEVLVRTEAMRAKGAAPHRISSSNTNHLYWTLAQLVAHHTCGGCNLMPGDLFGSGTISASERSGWGSLAELSDDGKQPLQLPGGETRTFVQDGDEIILRARAERDGFAPIGFGDCTGIVRPAVPYN